MQTLASFQDRLAINELLNNYILSIDSHNNEQFADNFTQDGVYDSPWGIAQGREAILGNISYWHSSGITKGKRHFMGAWRITELNSSTAKVESNYWIAEAENIPGLVATGYYIDTLKKVNDVWRIAHRKQVVDPSFKINP
ncbi:MAG: nuclear transport factor 2 family protein [Cytophagia bacterium]|nr:nuclear transport factor 2 family protein [Cytophagia bacterium]NBW36774.1 nuclear transport factor 2 family protein [Cytophagia bacterium]